MANKYVYLVGPIAGCSVGEANDWRTYVSDNLPDGVVGVSPLRCEPLIGKKYQVVYDDPRFGTARAIAAKNEIDTRECDIILAHLPKEADTIRPSYGSIIEMAWAYAMNKRVILVSNDININMHPLIDRCASWKLKTLDEALDVIEGIYDVYV